MQEAPKSIRPMWLSNHSRAPTGYGQQTDIFTPMLKAAGYDVAIAAFYGIEGAPEIDGNGITVFPPMHQAYMNDVIEAHMAYHRANCIISLIDPWVLDPNIYQNLNWAAWTPIDSEPISPGNKSVLLAARWVWAMSKFGIEQLEAAGYGDKTLYVPHGVDSEIFKPGDRREAREKLAKAVQADLTDKFLVVMNSANKGQPSRKGFYEAFAAFKKFEEFHPDAVLYVHADVQGFNMGEPLDMIRELVGLPKEKVLYPPQYPYNMGMLPPKFLANVYNAADVFLQTSHGEGFGIPIVEAQMCGCPVIVTDFSAMRELCFSGWKVGGVKFMHVPGALQMIPNVTMVEACLKNAYYHRNHDGYRQAARAGALPYDKNAVFEKYMLPALKKIEEALKPEPESAVVNG